MVGNGEEERELRRRALIGPEQHGGDNGCTGARHARDHRQTLRDTDVKIHQQRKPGGVMLARLEIELVDPEQDGAADDQREAHHPGIEQQTLDVFAADETDDDGGKERHQHADHEVACIDVTREHPDRDVPQFLEVQHDDREDRAELDQDRKRIPERAFAEMEKALSKQQMAGRGHGKELGHTLDDAEDHCPYCI
ncbi:hypothetical protein ACVWZK_000931 [Bradyrhizobium sp. GM0.4]